MSKSKRTGKSLAFTPNNCPKAELVTLGFTEEQAQRMMNTRRVLPIVETHHCIKKAAEAAKQGHFPVWRFKATASDWEKAIKSMVCEVLTGYPAGYWRDAIGGNRGIRDVLNDEDLILYSRCYDTAVTLFRAGFTDVEEIKPILQESFGGRINPADYGLLVSEAA